MKVVLPDADGPAMLAGPINANGGGDGGGDIEVSSGDDLTVSGSASLSATASSFGPGGSIDLDGGAVTVIIGNLNANGGSASGGSGGANFVSGCTVRIDEQARLRAEEPGGLKPDGAIVSTARELTQAEAAVTRISIALEASA